MQQFCLGPSLEIIPFVDSEMLIKLEKGNFKGSQALL